MSTKEFAFVGFLPIDRKPKQEKLEEVKRLKQTLIFYEAPHKLINSLMSIQEILGDRKIVVAKEITKIHEEYLRGNVSNVLEKINNPKGEYVIIVEGSTEDEADEKQNFLNNLTLEEHYEYYKKQGYEKKEIIKKIAQDKKTNKNEIYKHFI